MVGEEEVTSYSEYNDLPESKGQLVPLTAKGNFEPRPHRLKLWRPPKVRTEALRGFTYFIRVGNSIKIGSSGKFEQRLKALQIAHAKPLEVLAVVPAAIAPEFEVHQIFDGLRTRGEWFRADRELLYFIEKVKADAEAAGHKPAKFLPPPPTPFELARRPLYALRKGRKATDPISHACHNLIEMSKNLEAAKDEIQIGLLKKSMGLEVQRLARLRTAA